ncbi:MAG: tetratricopeptide repeat protein [Acidobacteriota bacterium]|nr:tetratricopeptide repeat protein [Acidobacteriota bacterium]
MEEAEKLLADYLKVKPSSADGHFLLGYVYFRLQKAKESLAEFTAGAKYRRPDPSDLKIVASDYVLLKDFADAEKWFSAIVTESPMDADAWYLLGRTQYNEEEFEKAIKSFRQALSLRPQYIEAENNLGLALSAANKKADAEAAFKTAIDWQGETPRDAQPFLNVGTLLVESHKSNEALPYLTKAVTLANDNPKAHQELAKAFTELNQMEKAQSELESAVKLAPDISSLHYQLAQVYRKRGLSEQAQREFDICEKLGAAHSSTETPNPPR